LYIQHGGEPFEINLVGEILTVRPQADKSFDIFRGETKLSTLTYSIDKDTGAMVWETTELISSAYVKQMGELIEEKM
jgi:hypothetical protein